MCSFHKSYNSPQVVQRVVDKVLLGVDYGVVSGVVHGVEVCVFNSPARRQLAIHSCRSDC